MTDSKNQSESQPTTPSGNKNIRKGSETVSNQQVEPTKSDGSQNGSGNYSNQQKQPYQMSNISHQYSQQPQHHDEIPPAFDNSAILGHPGYGAVYPIAGTLEEWNQGMLPSVYGMPLQYPGYGHYPLPEIVPNYHAYQPIPGLGMPSTMPSNGSVSGANTGSGKNYKGHGGNHGGNHHTNSNSSHGNQGGNYSHNHEGYGHSGHSGKQFSNANRNASLDSNQSESHSHVSEENTTVFVGSIPFDASEDEIKAHFSKAGVIQSVKLLFNPATSRFRGSAFIKYDTLESARKATEMKDPFKGRDLYISMSTSKPSYKHHGQQNYHNNHNNQNGQNSLSNQSNQNLHGIQSHNHNNQQSILASSSSSSAPCSSSSISPSQSLSSFASPISSPSSPPPEGIKSIFVGNLAPSIDENGISQFLSPCGTIVNVKLILDRLTGISKGFAFVEFTEEECAHKAVKLNGFELLGRQVKISYQRPRSFNASPSSPRGGYGGHRSTGSSGYVAPPGSPYRSGPPFSPASYGPAGSPIPGPNGPYGALGLYPLPAPGVPSGIVSPYGVGYDTRGYLGSHPHTSLGHGHLAPSYGVTLAGITGMMAGMTTSPPSHLSQSTNHYQSSHYTQQLPASPSGQLSGSNSTPPSFSANSAPNSTNSTSSQTQGNFVVYTSGQQGYYTNPDGPSGGTVDQQLNSVEYYSYIPQASS